MKLKAKINDHKFTLSVGSGHNDWVWFGHFAAKQYAKIAYPIGMYLPTQITIEDHHHTQYYPHPRQKIVTFLQENKLSPEKTTVNIRIRKANHNPTQIEKDWQKEAYGIERYMMNIIYLADVALQMNKEQFYFKLQLTYTMHNDVKHIFQEKKYPNVVELELEAKVIAVKMFSLKTQIRLPFGKVVPELICYRRDPKEKDVYRPQKAKFKFTEETLKESFMVTPKFVSIEESNSLVAEQMQITDSLHKKIQQKELQAKKRNANSSLCCYTFENLWKILQKQYSFELSLSDYEGSTIERIKVVIQKSLSNLYEIFFYYFIIENQQKQKKQELGITYQHVMHFLKYYQIFSDLQGLMGFLQYYNSDFKFKNIKDTVDIDNKCIRFPQFITILLRAIQFLQTSVYSVKGETFDVSVIKIVDRIQQIDSQEEQFGQFKRNLRENPKIISFFRQNAPNLKKIFVNQATRSVQNSGDNYVIMRQQIKEMLQLSGLTGKNINTLVQDLFLELSFSQDGIFYYEFVEAIQWLSLAVVSSDKDSTDLVENQQEQAMLIIEKIKFFIDKIEF